MKTARFALFIALLSWLAIGLQGMDAPCAPGQERLKTYVQSLGVQPPNLSKVLLDKERKAFNKELEQLRKANNKPVQQLMTEMNKKFSGKPPLVYFGHLRFLAQHLYMQHLFLQFCENYLFHDRYMLALQNEFLGSGDRNKTFQNGYCWVGIRSNNPATALFLLKYSDILNDPSADYSYRLRTIAHCLCSDQPKVQRLGQAHFYILSGTFGRKLYQMLQNKLINFYEAFKPHSDKLQTQKQLGPVPYPTYVVEGLDHLLNWFKNLLIQQEAGILDDSKLTPQDLAFHKNIRKLCEKYNAQHQFFSKLYSALLQEMNSIVQKNFPDNKETILESSLSLRRCGIHAVDILYDHEATQASAAFQAFEQSGFGGLLHANIQQHIKHMYNTSELDRLPTSLPIFRLTTTQTSWLPMPTIKDQLLAAGVDAEELDKQKACSVFLEKLKQQRSKPAATKQTEASKPIASHNSENSSSHPTNTQSVVQVNKPEAPAQNNKPAQTESQESDDILCFQNPQTGCTEIVFKLSPKSPIKEFQFHPNYTQTIHNWLSNPQQTIYDLGYLDPKNPRSKYWRECPWACTAFHAFSPAIDNYVQRHGECNCENTRMHIKIPGMMIYPEGQKRNGKIKETGVYHYIVDRQNGQCFHRMFIPIDSEQFFTRVWENKELYKAEFPSLSQSFQTGQN